VSPYLKKKKKNTHTKKKTGRVAQGAGPEFKPQYCQKKKRKESFKSSLAMCQMSLLQHTLEVTQESPLIHCY
jgi:hypothetical protein